MFKVKTKFFDFLKSKNLHITRQREVIIDAFLKEVDHVSLEEFSTIVRKIDSTIGETTVFRMLKLLVESGIAEEVDMGDKITRYELIEGKDHHDHLICKNCGACIEAVSSDIERLQKLLCEKYDFVMQDHRLEIFGLCKDCRKD